MLIPSSKRALRLLRSCRYLVRQAVAPLSTLLGGALLIWSSAAWAQNCGTGTSDYNAVRTVAVGGSLTRLTVQVSGARVREETNLGSVRRVTIRDPAHDRAIMFDPDNRRGIELPPPQRPRVQTRVIDEPGLSGTRVRRVEFKRDGAWIELSRTVCRADGIMLRQDFISIDQENREVRGTMIQDEIRVGPVPAALFEVPKNLELGRP